MNAYNTVARSEGFQDDNLVEKHISLVKRIAQHLAARLDALSRP